VSAVQAAGLTVLFGLWLLAGVAGAQSSQSSPDASVIDRTVAVVDGRVITLSELDFEARVGLIQRGGIASAEGPLDDETLRAALQLSIAERLENLEGDRLQAFPVGDAEVEVALQQFRSHFANDSEFLRFLDRHEADQQQLSALLGRRLRAAKVLDSRVRLRARASDAEVRRYYDEHQDVYGPAFEKVREQIQEKLFREHYQELVKGELGQLRKSADVRLIAPFARTPVPARSGL
jgi:hypothetical protein